MAGGCEIRRGEPADLPAALEIQTASPEASAWDPAGYLPYDFRVAVCENCVAGFVVARATAEDEREILNVAVHPKYRRRGVARALVNSILEGLNGTIFLEVRASNSAARELYKVLGFQEVTLRPGYYDSPPEAAIVMKFHSC